MCVSGARFKHVPLDLAQHVAEVEVRIGDLLDVLAADRTKIAPLATGHRAILESWGDDKRLLLYRRLRHSIVDLGPENIFHRVQTGRLSRQELGRVERAADEAVAIECPVAQFEGLAQQAENDGMLAGRIGDPEGVDA